MTSPQPPTQQELPCPHCGMPLDLSLPTCGACGLQLRGPRAVRLWQVDRQLETLTEERRILVEERSNLIAGLLIAPAPGSEPSYATAATPPAAVAKAPTSPSGQQLLLGLGALLLLSAAAIFVLVVWILVGVWGQALILCVMTALSVTGAALATRRRLPAAAETGAVLASGLTVVGAWAAWTLDLVGLRAVSFPLYAALASIYVGGLVLGYDRLVPRRTSAGEPLRPIRTYRPFATAALSVVPWWVFAEVEPRGVGVPVGLGLVALVSAALWFATHRRETHGLDTPRREGLMRAVPTPPTWAPALGTLTAALLYVVLGVAIAHDLDSSTREWSALLMIVSAALVAVGSTKVSMPAQVQRLVPVLVTIVAAPAAWSFTWEAHWAYLVGAAAVIAVATVALTYVPFAAGTSDSNGHRCAQVVAALAGAGLTIELFLARVVDNPTLFGNEVGTGPDLLWVAGVPAVWAVAALVVAIRLRSVLWLVYAHLALTVALFIGLSDSDLRTDVMVWMVAAVALAVMAAGVVLRQRSGRAWFGGWDLPPSLFAAGFALMSVVASVMLPHPWTAWTLIVAGVVAFAFSLLPARLPVAYGAAPVISVGVGLLTVEAGWDVIEAYTWPLALLLAVIGWLHWRRDRQIRSRVSMGSALSAALLPSTLIAIEGGDTLRLVLVTAAGVIVLVLGLVLRLQAPVAVAAVALVVIAVNQGGPYVGRVDPWVTLGLAGIALLTIGVSWERAVVAGRRSSAWFGHLR